MKKILLLCAIIISEFVVGKAIFSGGIPFWFDPARDLLLALKNLESLTLIGPPSGIPGIFYGPYWIWLLSFSLRLTRDPGLITLLVLGIPYAVFYPIILFKFSKHISPIILFIISFLFITNFLQYAVQLWNPHLASLLILLLIYSLTSKFSSLKKQYGFCGIILGLLLTIHISFGSVMIISTIVFLMKQKQILKKVTFLSTGFFLTLIPFIIFEIRHSFLQSKTLLVLISSSVQGKFDLVSERGLSKIDLIENFLSTFSNMFGGVEKIKLGIFMIVLVGVILIIIKMKEKINSETRNIFWYCVTILIVTLCVYLLARNPVWSYHFIGLETPIFILIGIIATRISFFRYFLYVGFILNIYLGFVKYIFTSHYDPEINSTYSLKKHVTLDALKQEKGKFGYFAYSRGVYTPDYDYLFDWLGSSRIIKDEDVDSDRVYLIIPKSPWGVFQDFINFKTPISRYKTKWAKTYKDGTTLILRVKS